MTTAVLLWGASGAGKSSTTRELLGLHSYANGWSVGARFAAMGRYSGSAVDGADTLAKSTALWRSLLAKAPARTLLLDGQIFTGWALDAMRGRFTILGVLLDAPADVLAARRRMRGSPPMPASVLNDQRVRWCGMLRRCDRSLVIDTSELSVAQVARRIRGAI